MLLNNILEAVGKTPLVKLNKITKDLRANIYVKCEFMNPGGSVKDRIAVRMIEMAEKNGVLKKGGTIIEATAGNTGIGLAMVAAIKGYRCIFVVPQKMSIEKINILKAYGAEVIVVPNAPPDSPENYNNYANRLASEIPNAFRPSQFTNLENPMAHYLTTGPEIYEDLNGKVDVLVAGVGTGGTISGTGKYLKERIPHIYVIAADPAGSVLSGDYPGLYKVEGIGEDFVPTTLNAQIINEFIRITDQESFSTARLLAREEGILAGGSAGTALAAALKYARRENKEENIVVILPDTGRNYLSKLYSDEWMLKNNFKLEIELATVDIFLKELEIYDRELITIEANKPISEAIKIMNKFSISQLPVVSENKIVGHLSEEGLLYSFNELSIDTKVSEVSSPPLPSVDINATLDEVRKLLSGVYSAVIVNKNGKPFNIITRVDFLNYITRRKNEV